MFKFQTYCFSIIEADLFVCSKVPTEKILLEILLLKPEFQCNIFGIFGLCLTDVSWHWSITALLHYLTFRSVSLRILLNLLIVWPDYAPPQNLSEYDEGRSWQMRARSCALWAVWQPGFWEKIYLIYETIIEVRC